MKTISNQTCTKCQHCGEWTNYADDPHHKARMQALVARSATLDEIALRAARRIMPLMSGSIKELCQLQAHIQVVLREALDEVPNAIELTGRALFARSRSDDVLCAANQRRTK